jgi:hypothetical protein
MSATLADLEKQIAALKAALDGKKDKKTAEQEAAKQDQLHKASIDKIVARQNELVKDIMETQKLDARFGVLEGRLMKVESEVKVALAIASHK